VLLELEVEIVDCLFKGIAGVGSRNSGLLGVKVLLWMVAKTLGRACSGNCMVDVIFADVAQPDQARIVAVNAHSFLKNSGHVVISIKANCVDSTAEPAAVFAGEVEKMKQEKIKPIEQLTLEPYERDHAVVVGRYRPPPKK
ncbi:hypothetical protein RRG08_065511, partial [Elysia crispata]